MRLSKSFALPLRHPPGYEVIPTCITLQDSDARQIYLHDETDMSRPHLLFQQLIESEFDFQRVDDISWIESCDDEEHEILLGGLAELSMSIPSAALAKLLHRVLARQHHLEGENLTLAEVQVLSQMYSSRGSSCPARHLTLAILNADGSETALHESVELLISDPLQNSNDIAVALAPFFRQQHSFAVDALFPRLFDGLDNLAAAPSILDLANYLCREDRVDEHPAEDRKEALLAFFGNLIQRLAVLQERPEPPDQEDSARYRLQIQESISLAVSMCDAIALLQMEEATGKLFQALELKHRRLRTEAAAALASLGEEGGAEVLVQLAAEPIARLRVLKYCEELGISERVPDEFCTLAARAESELSLWLSQPPQFGIPPMKCELIDERTLYWPGYEELVDCFLFRYEYQFQDGAYSNIGIAGPLTQSLAVDLSDLPPEDIYAVFAGYDAEHEEMVEYEMSELDEYHRADVSRLERRLRDHGYYDIETLRFGSFFGERYIIAKASLDGASGMMITDSNELMLCPTTSGSQRSLGVNEAAFLYRGRKLIRTFNA